MSRFEPIALGLLALAVGVVLMLTSGCTSAIGAARSTVLTAAEAVVVTDAPLANGYTHAAAEALQASDTIEEYRERIAPWEAVVKAQHGAVAALRAAESAIDTWERTDQQGPFVAVIGCAARAVSRLLELAHAVGLDPPALVTNTAEMLRQYLGANCEETSQ